MSCTKTNDTEIESENCHNDIVDAKSAQEHDTVPMYASDESCNLELDTTEDVRKILELRKKAVFVREVAMTISLVPFVFVNWPFTNGWIGWCVVFNGALCHGAHAVKKPWANKARVHDVLWNVLFVMYVNIYTHWQPQTLFISLFMLGTWLANGGTTEPGRSCLVHIILVQWAGWVPLLFYEYKL